MIKVSSLKCKISKGGYAKLSHKLNFPWVTKLQVPNYSEVLVFFLPSRLCLWLKKKRLSRVITRLEIQHHSNFYQAASILFRVKLTRTFKLTRVITRLEIQHHSNFYQAASILCRVKLTRTFKLTRVITRLEIQHHSNFYQAASILCRVKLTRTFKLTPRYCLLTVACC